MVSVPAEKSAGGADRNLRTIQPRADNDAPAAADLSQGPDRKRRSTVQQARMLRDACRKASGLQWTRIQKHGELIPRNLTDHAKSIFQGQLCLCVQSEEKRLSGAPCQKCPFSFLTFLPSEVGVVTGVNLSEKKGCENN